MHPELALEQHYYNFMTTLLAKKAWHQITQYFAQLHLLAKVWQVQSGDIVTSNVRHLEYYKVWRNSIITVSAERYSSLQITNHLYLCSKKDVATLSQHLQCILLKIHQYRVQIIYKLVIEAQSCRGQGQTHKRHGCPDGCHTECGRMHINGRNTTSIFTGWLPSTTKSFIIAGWHDTKDKLHADLRPYWSYWDELMVIDGIILKGRHIVIPNSLRQQVLSQLHTNHMGIEKTKLLSFESVYWSSINADIKGYIKHSATCLEFQQTQPKEKIIHHGIPLGP